MKTFKKIKHVFAFIILLCAISNVYSGTPFITSLNPQRNAVSVIKSSNINITYDENLDASTVTNSNIKVYGDKTGLKTTSISYNTGTFTITINPNIDFLTGEKIEVILKSGIRSAGGVSILSSTYSFTVKATGGFCNFVSSSIPVNATSDIWFSASGDIDSDDDLDLVIYEIEVGYKVLKNDGSGNFNLSQTIPYTDNLMQPEFADVDNDGDLDIVTFGFKMDIYRNNGSGSFTLSISSSDDINGYAGIFFTDLNRDGALDIIYSDGSSMKMKTVSGNDLITDTLITNISIMKFNCGDITNDGKTDIIIGDGYFLKIYVHDYDDSFFRYGSIPTGGLLPFPFSIFNADNDNDLDLSLTPSDVSRIKIYINTIECFVPYCYPNFNFYSFASEELEFAQQLTGDLDGDSDLDILSKTWEGYVISKNNGDGSFTYESSDSASSLNKDGIASGDFDNDGDIDFVYGEFSSLYLMKNQLPILPTTLNIKAIIEGFYNTSINKLNMRDTIKSFLRNSSAPFEIIDSALAVIDSVTFIGNYEFTNIPTGRYYIVLKHRNGLETWSKSGGELITNGQTISYDFTVSDSQAYGGNLKLRSSKYCIYSGDVDQDGVIDASDLSLIDNDASSFAAGYLNTDLDGNGFVDGSDMALADNNARNFVTTRNPIVGDSPTPEQVKSVYSGSSGKESKLSKLSKESELSMKEKLSNNVSEIPEKFELSDNFPNPFNPTTKINYELPVSNFVSLKVFDIAGKEVASLVNEKQNAGRYSVEFNANNLSSGTYFYKISATGGSGEFVQVKKLILVK